MSEADRVFNEGLAGGYGSSKRSISERGSFKFEVSHTEFDGAVHHDEWIADKLGVGGETIRLKNGEEWGRVYGGGVVSDERLRELGITKKDVTNFLKKMLVELKGKTRLDKYCIHEDGDWLYEYKPEIPEEEIPVVLGQERIYYQENITFLHAFVKSPIK